MGYQIGVEQVLNSRWFVVKSIPNKTAMDTKFNANIPAISDLFDDQKIQEIYCKLNANKRSLNGSDNPH